MLHVQLHPDREHEEAHPDLAEEPKRAERRLGKDEAESGRGDEPEEGGAQKDAGGHLADDLGLAEPARRAADQARRHDDDEELDEQVTEGVLDVGPHPFGGIDQSS